MECREAHTNQNLQRVQNATIQSRIMNLNQAGEYIAQVLVTDTRWEAVRC